VAHLFDALFTVTLLTVFFDR